MPPRATYGVNIEYAPGATYCPKVAGSMADCTKIAGSTLDFTEVASSTDCYTKRKHHVHQHEGRRQHARLNGGTTDTTMSDRPVPGATSTSPVRDQRSPPRGNFDDVLFAISVRPQGQHDGANSADALTAITDARAQQVPGPLGAGSGCPFTPGLRTSALPDK